MKWVTRERPKIDRIACPWLIARFIDREPEFLFVPPGDPPGKPYGKDDSEQNDQGTHQHLNQYMGTYFALSFQCSNLTGLNLPDQCIVLDQIRIIGSDCTWHG